MAFAAGRALAILILTATADRNFAENARHKNTRMKEVVSAAI